MSRITDDISWLFKGVDQFAGDYKNDPLKRPPYDYATLCAKGISACIDDRATLSEIYNWISRSYPYYGQSWTCWQNSIRHTLSHHKCFVRVEGSSRVGRGATRYWTFAPGMRVNFTGDGVYITKRCLRKRKGSNVKLDRDSMSPDIAVLVNPSVPTRLHSSSPLSNVEGRPLSSLSRTSTEYNPSQNQQNQPSEFLPLTTSFSPTAQSGHPFSTPQTSYRSTTSQQTTLNSPLLNHLHYPNRLVTRSGSPMARENYSTSVNRPEFDWKLSEFETRRDDMRQLYSAYLGSQMPEIFLNYADPAYQGPAADSLDWIALSSLFGQGLDVPQG